MGYRGGGVVKPHHALPKGGGVKNRKKLHVINRQLLNKIIKQALQNHIPRIWSDISTSTQIVS